MRAVQTGEIRQLVLRNAGPRGTREPMMLRQPTLELKVVVGNLPEVGSAGRHSSRLRAS